MQTTTSAFHLRFSRGLHYSRHTSPIRPVYFVTSSSRLGAIPNPTRLPPSTNNTSRQFTTTTTRHRSWPLSSLAERSESNPTLIFHSTSTNPYHNLSLEHYILTHSHPSSRTLLFYTNKPCVVIGRNQNPWLECHLSRLLQGGGDGEIVFDDEQLQNNGSHIRSISTQKHSRTIDLIRRRSGGGTVFHDLGNLNYSVIVPHDREFTRRRHAEMVVRALTSLGSFQGQEFGDIKVNDRNDIVMSRSGSEGSWLKISGSAFKLTRYRALHHGTLLYSSPNLEKISGLLRSPGRELITAKGVESVRSKVGNLGWVEDLRGREQFKKNIVQKIVREFWSLYGGQKTRDNEVEVEIGDADCEESANSKIAAGVAEMKTNDWRFNQTPRFDFSSGVVEGAQLKFQAVRGVIEKMSTGPGDSYDNQGIELAISNSGILHNIADWTRLLGDAKHTADALASPPPMPEALIQRVESIFPVWPENGHG